VNIGKVYCCVAIIEMTRSIFQYCSVNDEEIKLVVVSSKTIEMFFFHNYFARPSTVEGENKKKSERSYLMSGLAAASTSLWARNVVLLPSHMISKSAGCSPRNAAPISWSIHSPCLLYCNISILSVNEMNKHYYYMLDTSKYSVQPKVIVFNRENNIIYEKKKCLNNASDAYV